MEKVKLLSYEDKPFYQHFREILLQGLKAIGQRDDGILDIGLSENGDLQTKPIQKVFTLYLPFSFLMLLILN